MACFCVTACRIQMKGKAYNKFSLPPNQKATAGKAGALRLRGGPRNPPRRPQRSPSKTYQSPAQSFPLAGSLHANGSQACQPVRLPPSTPCLMLFINCTKYSLHGFPLAQCPCSPSFSSLHSAEKATSNLGSSDSRIWERKAAWVCKQHQGLCILLCFRL